MDNISFVYYRQATLDTILSDILSIIFCELSSYDRSTICSVCKRWTPILIGLIRPSYKSIDAMLLACDYHAIVRHARKQDVCIQPSTLSNKEIDIFMRLLRGGEGSLAQQPLDCLKPKPTDDLLGDVLYAACRLDKIHIVSLICDEDITRYSYCIYLIALYSPYHPVRLLYDVGVSLSILIDTINDTPVKDRCIGWAFDALCGWFEGSWVVDNNDTMLRILSQRSYDQLNILAAHAKKSKNISNIKLIGRFLNTGQPIGHLSS